MCIFALVCLTVSLCQVGCPPLPSFFTHLTFPKMPVFSMALGEAGWCLPVGREKRPRLSPPLAIPFFPATNTPTAHLSQKTWAGENIAVYA